MSSVTALPLSKEDLRRAAEEVIAQYGGAALPRVEQRVQALRAEGYLSVAKTWELIGDVVAEAQRGRSDTLKGYLAALDRGVCLSE